jgi:cell division protein FtsI/penicillin-binding protein 2
LQSAVERACAGRPGAALVAEISTGRLLASYRPERARTRAEPPGSVLKPFTLAAWMDAHAGAAPPAWPCPRQLRIAGRRLDCTHPAPAAPLDAAAAIAYSCNCWFAHLALELKPAEFAAALRPLAAQVSTAVTAEDLQLQAIGEWGIQVTPTELLAAYRKLALRRAGAALRPVFEGLDGAVVYGTAQLAAAPELQVAGKTGTGLGHAWFAGFAPAPAPEIVVVVFLDRGRGGADAAPIASEIFRAYARRERR